VLYPIRNAEAVNTGKAELAALGVKALDPATVEVTLEAPTPYFLQLLTHQTALPVNAKAVAEFSGGWVRPGKMVSNGAYMLADAKPGAQIRLVKNTNYWDAAQVSIDTVVFDPSENRGNVLRRYRAGEFDIADDVPNDQLDWLRKNMPHDLHIAPYAGVSYFSFNMTKPPFNDGRLRQALTMAVNREVLVEKITLAGELPAYGFVPDGTANYTSQKFSWAGLSQTAREAEAVKLMREAGYGPGKPLRFQLAYSTSENEKKIEVALAAMWKKLGVEVDLVNSELKVHYANLRQGDFQLGRAGWVADYNDAQNFLFLAQTSTKQQNFSRFSNPNYDRLMDQAAVTNDAAARAKLLQQAETILLKEVPVLPLYFSVTKSLVSPKVTGWMDNPFDVHSVRDLRLAD
jgi:ABC-type oligopeptide transport system substrate-binding subunit